MVRRPWPIVLMAFMHVLILPVFYHFLSIFVADLSFAEYHQQLIDSESYYTAISRFMLLPIAGAAIYITKRWSYYVFLATMIAVIACNILEHNAHLTDASFTVFLIVTCINVACVSYFFLPSVSRIYLDKRIRWWEQKQRYKVNVKAKVKNDKDETFDCTIENISTTGAKLNMNKVTPNRSDTLILDFKDDEFDFKINFDIVHAYDDKCGVRFFHDSQSKSLIKKYINYLIKNGAEPRNKIIPLYESFIEWLKAFRKEKTSPKK